MTRSTRSTRSVSVSIRSAESFTEPRACRRRTPHLKRSVSHRGRLVWLVLCLAGFVCRPAFAGTAVFAGDEDEVKMVARYARDSVVLEDGSYRRLSK